MASFSGLAQTLADAVSRTGPAAPAILFAASFVEYVFPPFPGDLVVVLGAWYAVDGALSWPATFVSVTAGAMLGAWIDYRVGAAVGRRLDRRLSGTRSLSAERLLRFEASYRRWGALLLVSNRFFPGVRAFFFLAAGAAGIPLRRVLLYGGLSAALWNAVLLGAGALFARNVEELVHLFEHYTYAAWWALGGVAAVALAGALWRRHAARKASRAAGEER
ncbi:DedA family protein [Anaeromyxobacter sp. Fw109-5]|uniref:DedA family protein n=1 Tax=Anaeromyxobacter sp. (strain Fw109-5) TaxID=404589 RepID=UPI000158A45E|nr:DedA family protein [Anaeromyxobacter sp. Fw109-5]ABS24394.1 SNARE associated Golgi protein [Anaeromyxobacter sp. Fw109-5]